MTTHMRRQVKHGKKRKEYNTPERPTTNYPKAANNRPSKPSRALGRSRDAPSPKIVTRGSKGHRPPPPSSPDLTSQLPNSSRMSTLRCDRVKREGRELRRGRKGAGKVNYLGLPSRRHDICSRLVMNRSLGVRGRRS